MELAALYDLQLAERGLLSFNLAPVGDPAIGPTAYPRRQSASEDPLAALGHHLLNGWQARLSRILWSGSSDDRSYWLVDLRDFRLVHQD